MENGRRRCRKVTNNPAGPRHAGGPRMGKDVGRMMPANGVKFVVDITSGHRATVPFARWRTGLLVRALDQRWLTIRSKFRRCFGIPIPNLLQTRTGGRRVGQECVSTVR